MASRRAWVQFEGDETLMWRADRMVDAGLDEALAASLALYPRLELHFAVDTIRAGLAKGVSQAGIYDLLAD